MPNIMDYFEETIRDGGDLDTLVKSPPVTLTDTEIIALRANYEEMGDYGALEITITFKPDIHGRYRSVTLTRMVFDLLSTLRKPPNTTLEVVLVGEFSHSGMYHMHGMIYCNSPRLLNRLRRKLSQNIGRTEIKMIHNVPRYIDYILKGLPERKILQEEVIRYIKRVITVVNIPKNYNMQ